MIGWDTNVLLRLALSDDPEQARLARESMIRHSEEGIRIDRIVLVEVAWAMRRVYRLDRDRIAGLLGSLLTIQGLVIDARGVVMQAVRRYASGRADFTDYLIGGLNETEGAAPTHTFDRRAAEEPDFALIAKD